MEKQIKRYMPSSEELEGLDQFISTIPELQEFIQESDYSLDLIIKGTDSLKMDESYKKGIKQLFIALQKTCIVKETFKYSTFRNQETIELLLQREKEYKKIIAKQAKKHKDNSGIDEMNKMFSSIVINPAKDKQVSAYTNKKIKDIKLYDDFKPIFEEEGEKVYTKEDLVKMKKNNKEGIRFNGVDSITVKNTSDDLVIMNKTEGSSCKANKK
jgi:hypothetical protein